MTILKKASTSFDESHDVEAAKFPMEKIGSLRSDVSSVHESLIPLSTIIDPNYQKLPGVEVKQSILDRQMLKKAIEELESDSETSLKSKIASRRASITSKAKSTKTSRTSRVSKND